MKLSNPGFLWLFAAHRVSSSQIGGLFECVAHLQHAPVVAVPADDLDADGKVVSENAQGTEIAGFPTTEM